MKFTYDQVCGFLMGAASATLVAVAIEQKSPVLLLAVPVSLLIPVALSKFVKE
jgi:hypothetical protein